MCPLLRDYIIRDGWENESNYYFDALWNIQIRLCTNTKWYWRTFIDFCWVRAVYNSIYTAICYEFSSGHWYIHTSNFLTFLHWRFFKIYTLCWTLKKMFDLSCNRYDILEMSGDRIVLIDFADRDTWTHFMDFVFWSVLWLQRIIM